ncbi:MAG: hypothetical protein FIA95_10215 [Gemmatimonadetes bacterium]|nr:hypothetical protein [Gemmatimonadota bacterium]
MSAHPPRESPSCSRWSVSWGWPPSSGTGKTPRTSEPGCAERAPRRTWRGAYRLSPGIVLVGIVVGAYLAAHVASEWLARRHLVVSGAEYLLLGVLLGPEVSGLIEASAVDGFAPFLTLAFGWVGALVGAQFHLPGMWRLPSAPFAIALAAAGLAGIALAAAMGALLVWGLGLEPYEAWVPALALASIGVSSAPAGIAVVARKLRARGPLLRQLHVATAVDALAAIVVFGLLLSASPPALAAGERLLTSSQLVLVSAGIGLGGGALFHLFLGRESHIDRLFIALAGALILASGAAAYLRVSPLLPALLIGFVLVNTSPSSKEIREVLARVERPLYFTLLVFAGAAWRHGGPGWLMVPAAFVTVRVLAKVGAAAVAARAFGALARLGPRWGWGLVGHGGLAVALALNYRMYDPSPLSDTVFTAALLSVLATDFFSARVVGAVVGAAPEARRGSPDPAGKGRP